MDAGAVGGLHGLRLRLPRRRGADPGGVDFEFDYSYGDPQPVQVLAKRSLGAVTLKYRINGGAVHSAPTSEWGGGDRYAPADVYYHELRGNVTGTSPGDSVEVWFEGGGQTSDSFTCQAVSETGHRVLVVATEDYSGISPAQTPGPHYLQFYLDALAANGVAADVYDVDARGRIAPDHIGVLGDYDGVIWYTGDDIVVRRTGRAGRQRRPAGARRVARVPRAASSTPARTPASSPPERPRSGRSGSTRRTRSRAGRCRSRPTSMCAAACRCAARYSAATSSTTRSSTGSAASSRSATTGPMAATCSTSTASATRSRA
ncbi:MAG TPA: hypothetical protein VKC52_14650 [Acidimicrobiia bacterium]|nr:hypothetical protein [Acidimicrobiia bacterium]